jgi:biopolymer transport protein ExbD
MRIRRSNKLLVEPPASATGDIAFNLIVFFLVCASVQPDSGRRQSIPRSEQQEEKQEDEKHVEVQIKRNVAMINGTVVADNKFVSNLSNLLKNKPREQDRVVVVKSDKEVEWQQWISVTEMIEQSGGIMTIQTEEEREVIIE